MGSKPIIDRNDQGRSLAPRPDRHCASGASTSEITDDQPYNKYFILRRRAPFALRLFGMQG